MGTNYYLKTDVCEHCNRASEVLHIGKSSAGWCFALHVWPDGDGPLSLEEWKLLFRDQRNRIEDEYGREITSDEMESIITSRIRRITVLPYGYESWEDFHKRNNSQEGPNSLIRSKVDGHHCVGHGEGTWDLITGEFS